VTFKIRYFTQLFVSYIVLLIAAILGLSVLLVSFFKTYIETQTIQNLSQQLGYIEQLMAHAGPTNDIDSILNLNDGFEGYNFRLTLISNDGHVYFDSFRDVNLLDNHYLRPEVQLAREQGFGSVIRFSESLNRKLVYVAKKSASGAIYRLALPIHYVQNEWAKIIQKVVGYTVFIFLLCLGLTFIMSHWISSPLKWSLNTLQKIKDRTFTPIVPQQSFIKEISNVNRLLLDVSEDIGQYINKISYEKEKKDMILNKMINGLMVVDSSFNIRLMNRAAYGLFFNLEPSDNRMKLVEYGDLMAFSVQIMSGKKTPPIEIEHDNGLVVLISGSMYTEGKAPRGILIAQDITLLKGLESVRQQFVANVSHELKTPITVIRSMFETIQTFKQKNIEISDELLLKGVHHTDRLSHIIDDLLQLAKLESIGIDIQKTLVNTNQLVDLSIQPYLQMAVEKNIKIERQVVFGDVYCNLNLMVQAVGNLIENAIKYSPAFTAVMISVSVVNNRVVISVKDQGYGIEEKHFGQLFQRFYRVDLARSRDMGGTGLGLAIVKHIAQAHKGHTNVVSKMNEGSTFSISLPVEDVSESRG
jgi:two-component system phosphate regulon sensor histidine kinase PhoR